MAATITTMNELTERMEGISHYDAGGNTSDAARPLVTPNEKDKRPWDLWKAAGPPANPIDFPAPRINRGRRVEVVCYIPDTGRHERLTNVLLSDEPRKAGVRELAYYPIPHKKPIKTIMGHVEICVVLKRCLKDEDTSLEEDDEEEVYVVEEEEDVVFELTEEYVAVKVNFDSKMQKLRNRHAEDPLKEIAAQQLIGEKSEHVMGCRDVLYDARSQTLNVVLRYCPHGDLFQMLQDFQNHNTDTPGLTEAQARYWFKQILLGLKYLRDLGICHRDLSPENVMMDHNQCLVIDLGMCLRVPYTDPRTGGTTSIEGGKHKRLFSPQGACGKLPYMSPEIYKNRHAFDGELADVWTAGTILFCMLTGNRSYGRPHSSDPQFYWMTHGLDQMLRDWGVPISKEGLHLMQNMLQVNPRLRLTLDEALGHPWFDFEAEEMDLSDPMLML